MEAETCQPGRAQVLPHDLARDAAPGATAPAAGGLWFSPNLWTVVVVLVITSAALMARLVLQPILFDDSAFLTCIFAVMLCSWYGGFRAGLLSTVLSAAGGWYLFLRPFSIPGIRDDSYLVETCLFLGIGFVVSAINEAWHRAKKRLITHEEFLSTVLESTPTGVLVLDEEGYVTFINTAAAALFGLAGGLLVGRPCTEIGLVPKPSDSGGTELSLNHLLQSANSGGSLRLFLEDAGTAPVEVEARVTPIHMSNHRPGGVVISLVPTDPSGILHV